MVRRLRPQVSAGADNCSILASLQQIANHTEPLREYCLMPIVRRHVVTGPLQVIGKVLLRRHMVRTVMSVQVSITVTQRLRTRIVRVAQMFGDTSPAAFSRFWG